MRNRYWSIVVFLLMFSCMKTTPRYPVLEKSSTFFKESVELNKKMNAEEARAFQHYMTNDTAHDYISSPSGFWYYFDLKNESNYKIQSGDELSFSYEVLNLNNERIYTKDDVGEQIYRMDQQEIVEGLRIGLKLMGVDDKATFLFPSHHLYGYLGDQNKIEVNQPLIYKVQLNKIISKNESK